jgi:hypothetical protein
LNEWECEASYLDDKTLEKWNEIQIDEKKILGRWDYGQVFLSDWNGKRMAWKQIKFKKIKRQKQEEVLTLLGHDHLNAV